MADQKQIKILVMKKVDGKPGKVYYPLETKTAPLPSPTSSQILLHPTHHSLNHRDLFLRQALYPSPSFTTPLLADTCAVDPSTGKRYVLNPGHGWISDPLAPEKGVYAILGGTGLNPVGTAVTELVIEKDEVVEVPSHLSSAEAAALPLAGLTGWRAIVTKSGAWDVPGANVLITGIGGGVALFALSFAVAKGLNVYVTSGSQEKLEKAKKLGAKGGVSYKDADWDKQLKGMLPKETPNLDAIIDGAGADILNRAVKLVKQGGVVVSYGMTVKPVIEMGMALVLKNVDVRGSTMGSRKEFHDMVEFVGTHKVKPVVDRVVKGKFEDIQAWDGLWEAMKNGEQFGKLVYEVTDATSTAKQSKL